MATRDTVSPAGPATAHDAASAPRQVHLVIYFLAGICFGFVLIKAQVVSWFRIQEMFRFQGFHLFGIFATAVPTALIGVQLLKRVGAHAVTGEAIAPMPKLFGRGVRYVAGGIIFGLGWALTGACPGPLFALLGSGIPVIGVVILSALAGTWTYGYLRPRLPH